MSCLLLVDCVKEKVGELIRGLQVQKGASGRGLLKTTFTEGGIGIFGLLFWLFFKSVFRFLYQKTTIFWFCAHCGLWIFRFLAFGFRFSSKILTGFRISSLGSGFFSICAIAVRLH